MYNTITSGAVKMFAAQINPRGVKQRYSVLVFHILLHTFAPDKKKQGKGNGKRSLLYYNEPGNIHTGHSATGGKHNC